MDQSSERTPLEKARDTTDMMISAHSKLRDEFNFRATVLDAAILVASAVVVSMTFADESLAGSFGWATDTGRWLVGSFGVAVFALALVSNRMAWHQKSTNHGTAAATLSNLKHEMRNPGTLDDQQLLDRYRLIMSNLTAIPDNQFLRLKSHHRSKIKISVLLDKYPGASVRIMRWKYRVRDTRRAWKASSPESRKSGK